MSDLRCAIPTSTSYIIIFVETWLCDSITNAELGFDNYTVFRCDRSVSTSECLRGGGVLIAVHNSFICNRIDVVSDIEQLFVEVRCGFKSFLFGSVYIPPCSEISVYEAHCRTVGDVLSRVFRIAI